VTPEGEKWIAEQERRAPVDWDSVHIHYLSRSAAKFWLSRIFAEIEREAVATEHEGYKPTPHRLGAAFERVKARFGL